MPFKFPTRFKVASSALYVLRKGKVSEGRAVGNIRKNYFYWDWRESSFRVCHAILLKNLNELFSPPNI